MPPCSLEIWRKISNGVGESVSGSGVLEEEERWEEADAGGESEIPRAAFWGIDWANWPGRRWVKEGAWAWDSWERVALAIFQVTAGRGVIVGGAGGAAPTGQCGQSDHRYRTHDRGHCGHFDQCRQGTCRW